MTRAVTKIIISLIFILCALAIGALFLFPSVWNTKKHSVERQGRIIIPQNTRVNTEDAINVAELLAREDSMTPRVAMAEGEVIVSILNGSFDSGPMENQFIAYRNLLEIESPIYLTYIEYDEASRRYQRVWTAQTAATRPGTISLYTQDLLGDRSICVLLSGVNSLGEHTLNIFRRNEVPRNSSRSGEGARSSSDLFSKLAEFRIDGSISVKEVERSQAYQMGLIRGQSFNIAAYGRDFESSNIMDQIEIIYSYNEGNGLYEQTSITRIPGTQIEQRRVRELLGNSRAFEEFITGLWYYMTPQGTIDKRQYIYFNPPSQEIIFYGDETQQVFSWQNSATTRYGLYISSQNISVTTLRRSIDIELESLESIKVRVIEDVRLKIGVNAPWDGSYKKAGPPENNVRKPESPDNTFINAYYNGPIGKIHFTPLGTYELFTGSSVRQGKYAFFFLNNQELLELRSETPSGLQRETYLVESNYGAGEDQADAQSSSDSPQDAGDFPRKTLTLLRVRIGARGIERLHEGAISLTLTSG